MAQEKQAKSSSHERKIDGYLKPANHIFVSTYVELMGISKSQLLNEAVKLLREKTAISK